MERHPFTEIGVCTLIVALCAVFLSEALALPPGKFEPLGSGPVPIWTAIVVIACCIGVIAGAIRFLRGNDMAAIARAEFGGDDPVGGAVVMGLTVAYVGALHLKLTGFGVVTFVYLALLILGLEGFARRRIVPALIVSGVVAFGAQYVFTEIFVVDLPV